MSLPRHDHSSRLRSRTASLLTMLVVGWLPIALATRAEENPFADFVRKTEARTPEQEQQSFHLPPGFEIQLVAAEPDISKPINMAFDARGQLWITQSREYPLAAPTNRPGRDAILALGDFAQNGRARKITTFADGLNIPIGIYPYQDGVIAFSIPAIYHFQDTDGDGRADQRKVLYSGQGYTLDTHGLTSAFRRGYDGWLYACHGYRNDSTLAGADGHTITMNSGNTYRMRVDGARVEIFSRGLVNPFGLAFDPLGDLYSADCHSSPVYMLLRGAYYPSFGKPHDGLGFGPGICNHSHGSTAIAGIAIYAADQFPPEYRGNSFIGNVMTCRINRDSFQRHGSTSIAQEQPDFLSSDDPWFRPVDIQLGPDGALYVADFYNRIIGHYEVPLDHPGRDRERGRIWRIVYRGDQKILPQPQDFNLVRVDAAGLIQHLAHPNLTVRMQAMHQLVDRVGKPAVHPVEAMMRDAASVAAQRVHGLWVLHRLNALSLQLLYSAARDTNRDVRVHALRVLSETSDWPPAVRTLAVAGLNDPDAFVQRAAADALGCHAQSNQIFALLSALARVPAQDTQLSHTLRMALRNQLTAPDGYAALASFQLSEIDSRTLADVSLGVTSAEAGRILIKHLTNGNQSRDRFLEYLRHASRYAPDSDLAELSRIVSTRFPHDPDTQFACYQSVREGFVQRGGHGNVGLQAWAASLAKQLLAAATETNSPWSTLALTDADSPNPWALESLRSSDGDTQAIFLSSRPIDEKATGIIRSQPFRIPTRLSFYLAGHDGAPDAPPVQRDFVRLIAVDTGEVLRQTSPPRNDIAQPVIWDLAHCAGRMGIIEIVDGHNATGYAWLAAGRFQPPVAPLPEFIPLSASQRQQHATELIRTVPLPELEGATAQLYRDPTASTAARLAAAQTLTALKPDVYVPQLVESLSDTNHTTVFRERLTEMIARMNVPVAQEATLHAMTAAPRRAQIKLAQALATTRTGAEKLLTTIEARRLPAQLLTDRTVKENLTAARLPEFPARSERLTTNLPAANQELQKLIDQRRAGFDPARASVARGTEVFRKVCAVCHQIDGQGAVVGPQLDGVGARGLERLAEDVLDPNRDVDPAFRSTNVTLKDDTVITGLLRREVGQTLVFADAAGREITVAKNDIFERRESTLSLMPANMADMLSASEFNDLMAFLLSHGTKPPPKN